MQHLFFDLDGTLTDPAPGIVACLKHAVRLLGGSPPSEARLRRCIGPPLRGCFAELLGTDDEATIEEAVRRYRERFTEKGLYENSVYAGVTDVLEQLVDAGTTLCIVTSKPTTYADRIIDHFGLRRFFAAVYGAELSGQRSDKTELVAHALEGRRARATAACMIGDREHDVLGGRARGVTTVGVTWGYGTRRELEAAGACEIVDVVAELPAAIARATGRCR